MSGELVVRVGRRRCGRRRARCGGCVEAEDGKVCERGQGLRGRYHRHPGSKYLH